MSIKKKKKKKIKVAVFLIQLNRFLNLEMSQDQRMTWFISTICQVTSKRPQPRKNYKQRMCRLLKQFLHEDEEKEEP